MTLWILFLLVSFLAGSAMWRKPASTRMKLVVVLCLLAGFGYYVFHLL